MATATATLRDGSTLSADYTVGLHYPGAILYSSLKPQPGEPVSTVFNRAPQNAVIEMDPGVYECIDFAVSNYGFYSPKPAIVYAALPDTVVFTIKPMSSTKASQVPVQGTKGATNQFTLFRTGPNNSTSGVQVIWENLTFVGTPQPQSPANPGRPGHNFQGPVIYWGRKSTVRNCKFFAASFGSGNSPPDETFSLSTQHDVDTLIQGNDVDGRNQDGSLRVGGSPCGLNHSLRAVVKGNHFHHGYVSGVTASTSGTPDPAGSNWSRSPQFIENIIEHQANTAWGGGLDFSAINLEQVGDTVDILNNYMQIDATAWLANHISAIHWYASAKIRIIQDPTKIKGGPQYVGDVLTLRVPKQITGQPVNKQLVSDITVTRPDGATLAPYVIASPPSGALKLDPNTQYALLVA